MARVSRLRLWCVSAACAIAAAAGVVATPARADSQSPRDVARMVVRPLQPRWIAPDSALPQPVSLEWLEGDEWAFQVQPIITDEELVAYSRLTGPEQRNAFLASFWAERDPTPGTTENEFQEEYVRRVQYANEHFGGASARAGFGFETDRGRMYLMFGAPDAIDAEGAAADPYETWRYASVSGIGADFRVRFSLARDLYCGYRILSPAPLTTIEAAGTARPGSEPHAVVQIYPLGLTAVSVPLDATRVVGAAYEILDRDGAQVDRGQIGSIESDAAAEPLSQHLSPGWLATGLGCTHALPAGRYTLSTAVRFATGEMQREAVTFDVS